MYETEGNTEKIDELYARQFPMIFDRSKIEVYEEKSQF